MPHFIHIPFKRISIAAATEIKRIVETYVATESYSLRAPGAKPIRLGLSWVWINGCMKRGGVAE